LSSTADPACHPGVGTKAAGMDEKRLWVMHGIYVE